MGDEDCNDFKKQDTNYSHFLVSLSLSLRFNFHDIGEICDVLEFSETCGYIRYTMAFFGKIIVPFIKIKFKGDVNLAYSKNILYEILGLQRSIHDVIIYRVRPKHNKRKGSKQPL